MITAIGIAALLACTQGVPKHDRRYLAIIFFSIFLIIVDSAYIIDLLMEGMEMMRFGGGYAGVVIKESNNGGATKQATIKRSEGDETAADAESWTAQPVQIFLLRFKILMYVLITMAMLLLLYLFSLVAIIMVFSFFIAFNRRNENISKETAYKNTQMMGAIGMVPYSSFLLCETRDCPICFESFLPEERVIQLKCNKHHIFHFDCMKEYYKSLYQ